MSNATLEKSQTDKGFSYSARRRGADPETMFREYRRSGNRELRNELVMEYQWIPERCARRFYGRGEPLADLVQVGQVALVGAVERFDPDVGNSFPKFAVPSVLGELKRHFRDRTWRISVSRRAKDLMPRVNAAIEELQARTGEPPTAAEIAEYLRVPVDDVADAEQANRAYRPVSTDHRQHLDDEQSAGESHLLRCDDDELERTDMRATVWNAIRTLDDESCQMLLWRFYEGCTQAEIGERLGIGQVQVSRRLRRCLFELEARIGSI